MSDIDKKVVLPWTVLAVAFGLSTVLMVVDLLVSKREEEKIFLKKSENVLSLTSETLSQSMSKSEIFLERVVSEFQEVFHKVQDDNGLSEDQDRATVLRSVNSQFKVLQDKVPESQIDSLRMISENGDVVFQSTDTTSPPASNLKERSYFQANLKANSPDTQFFAPIKLAVSNKWVIPITKKIKKKGGAFGGLALIFIKVEYFDDVFSKLRIGDNSSFSMIAMDGGVIARTPKAKQEIDVEFELDSLMGLINAGEGKGLVNAKSLLDGQRYDLKFVASNAAPFVLINAISEKDVYIHWNRKAWYYLLSWLLMGSMLVALWKLSKTRLSEVEEHKRIKEAFSAREKESASLVRIKSLILSNLSDELTRVADTCSQASVNLSGDEDSRLETSSTLYKSSYEAKNLSILLGLFDTVIDTDSKLTNEELSIFEICEHKYKDFNTSAIVSGYDFSYNWLGFKEGRYSLNHLCLEFIVNRMLKTAFQKSTDKKITAKAEIQDSDNGELFVYKVTNTGVLSSLVLGRIEKAIENGYYVDENGKLDFIGVTLLSLCAKKLGGTIKIESNIESVAFELSVPLQRI